LEAYYQEAGRGGRDGEPARALLLAARMDLGRLIRFINERDMRVEDVRRYVAALRRRADDDVVAIGHGELGDRDRVLLSIAERAQAVELQPGGRDGLLVRLTGRGSPRLAYVAIKAAKDRSWDSYRSIERFITGAERCRRRQILDHFGDEEQCAPSGRCCDVCDPDQTLEEAVRAKIATGPRRRAARGERPSASRSWAGKTTSGEQAEDFRAEQVDQVRFDELRAWRWERAEGKPAYTVAANAVLEEVLRTHPQSVDELLAIHGIGPAFCEKHGESLLRRLDELGAPEVDAEGVGQGPPPELTPALASQTAPT
jgi:ATP-dependent DNA helicase RecQ